jgi:hypothetical protein
LQLLTWFGLESGRGELLGPLLTAEIGDGPLDRAERDVDPLGLELLADDRGVPLGDGAVEVLNVLAEWPLKASRLGPFLEADRGSGEITTHGVAGEVQLAGDSFAPQTLAVQLADSIHDCRRYHPEVPLR